MVWIAQLFGETSTTFRGPIRRDLASAGDRTGGIANQCNRRRNRGADRRLPHKRAGDSTRAAPPRRLAPGKRAPADGSNDDTQRSYAPVAAERKRRGRGQDLLQRPPKPDRSRQCLLTRAVALEISLLAQTQHLWRVV